MAYITSRIYATALAQLSMRKMPATNSEASWSDRRLLAVAIPGAIWKLFGHHKLSPSVGPVATKQCPNIASNPLCSGHPFSPTADRTGVAFLPALWSNRQNFVADVTFTVYEAQAAPSFPPGDQLPGPSRFHADVSILPHRDCIGGSMGKDSVNTIER